MVTEIRCVPASLERHPDAARIIKLLERVEYTARPMRWEIRSEAAFSMSLESGVAGYHVPCGVLFCAVFDVRDVTDPDRRAEIFSPPFKVNDSYTDDFLLQCVHDAIVSFEKHEADEHFFVDGIKTHDPHNGERQAFKDKAAQHEAKKRLTKPYFVR
jgi:hypothetical protein